MNNTIRQKLISKAEEFYCEGSLYHKWNDNGIRLYDTLENILIENKINTYSIESEDLFDSPGMEIGYISLAWLEDNDFNHITFGTVIM